MEDHEDISHSESTEEEHFPKVIEDALGERQKILKEWKDLGPKQKKRRLDDGKEAVVWTAEKLLIPTETLLKSFHMIPDAPQKGNALSPQQALKLKDSVFLSDRSYQMLRNEVKVRLLYTTYAFVFRRFLH